MRQFALAVYTQGESDEDDEFVFIRKDLTEDEAYTYYYENHVAEPGLAVLRKSLVYDGGWHCET